MGINLTAHYNNLETIIKSPSASKEKKLEAKHQLIHSASIVADANAQAVCARLAIPYANVTDNNCPCRFHQHRRVIHKS